MPRSESASGGTTRREQVARHLQATGRQVAGERGGRIANRISEAIRCGRIDICNNPACEDCAPVREGS